MSSAPPPRRVLRVAPAAATPPNLACPPAPGEGLYRTVQEAVDAVPPGNTVRTTIVIPPGVYRQPLYVPKTKNFITFAGFRPETTVLTWDNTASRVNHHQASRLIGTGTFGCGSTIVEGEDFIAENITFENSAPQGSGQAVAIRVTAERCAFYNCRFLGWQDTLYLHYGKQYLKDCYIEGSVDFIFGNSTALLENCLIHCKSQGFITAQSRKSSQESTGYVFLRCVITGNGSSGYSYLGRPWGPFGRVVYAYTWMGPCIRPLGWHNWDKVENERTACFFEYRLLLMYYHRLVQAGAGGREAASPVGCHGPGNWMIRKQNSSLCMLSLIQILRGHGWLPEWGSEYHTLLRMLPASSLYHRGWQEPPMYHILLVPNV